MSSTVSPPLARLIPALCLATGACFSHPVCADTDDDNVEIVNELFLSDTATGQEAGEWQVTVSPQFEQNESDSTLLLEVELEYGITDQLQVAIEYTPFIHVDADAGGSESGDGNLEVGLQYSWVDVGPHALNVAIAWSHEFAEGDPAVVSEPGEQPEDEDNLYVVISKSIGDDGDTQAFVQLGNEIEDDENEAYLNLGVVARNGSRVLSGEFNWSDDQTFLTPGVTWVLEDGMEVGVGVPIAIDGDDDYKVIANLVCEWE